MPMILPNITKCRICGCEASHPVYIAQETIMGSFERFGYFKCLECGCLQIDPIPTDLARHYSANYQSKILEFGTLAKKSLFKKYLAWFLLFMGNKKESSLEILRKLFPGFLWQFKELGIHQHSKILDYGCGKAQFLFRLYSWGFENLYGLDPYWQGPEIETKGMVIKKGDYSQLRDQFDLIVLNHVIEHLEKPLDVLKILRDHLKENGVILVNTPLVDSYGWRKFGNAWAMWDPPRHLHIFSVKSMALAAKKCGLKVEKVKYDSGKNLWTTSQLFSMNPESQSGLAISQKELTKRQKPMNKFLRMIEAIGDSDMASFYLRIN
ncbi:SAM-dependent methyltransferase [Methylacidiphilum sp. Yel]|jgi:SAM-dependent methyltransferase|nr:SAM-dependent methyltransferase [Methylacidiphilum sp. Yel]